MGATITCPVCRINSCLGSFCEKCQIPENRIPYDLARQRDFWKECFETLRDRCTVSANILRGAPPDPFGIRNSHIQHLESLPAGVEAVVENALGYGPDDFEND